MLAAGARIFFELARWSNENFCWGNKTRHGLIWANSHSRSQDKCSFMPCQDQKCNINAFASVTDPPDASRICFLCGVCFSSTASLMPFLKAVPVSYETEGNITILTFPGSGLIDLPGLPAVHTSVRGHLVHFRLVRGRQRYVLTVFLAGGGLQKCRSCLHTDDSHSCCMMVLSGNVTGKLWLAV